jgi:hypothetical protein
VLQPAAPARTLCGRPSTGSEGPSRRRRRSPPAKPDETAARWSKFLKGDLPALVEVSRPAELLHFWQVLEPYAGVQARDRASRLARRLQGGGPELGSRKARVDPPAHGRASRRTRGKRINVPAELAKAGAEVAFAPTSDAPEGLQGWLFRVAELVQVRAAAGRGAAGR